MMEAQLGYRGNGRSDKEVNNSSKANVWHSMAAWKSLSSECMAAKYLQQAI